MTDQQPEPTTEAGRALLALVHEDGSVFRYEVEPAILAIEAEARADERERLAEAVRDIPQDEGDTGASRYINGVDYIALPTVLALLQPETASES